MRAEPAPFTAEPRQLALVALLPALAGATSIGTGLALGVTMTSVLLPTCATAAALAATPATVRLLLCALVAGGLTICIDLAAHAALPELHATLGPFLLATAPAALLQAPLSARGAATSTMHRATLPIAVLALVGACRELLGAGTLLADAGLLIGLDASAWRIRLPWHGFLAAAELPGALLAAALLMAALARPPARLRT